MRFTPELPFDGGRLKPLETEDTSALFTLYQQPELPGQKPLQDESQIGRMIDLSVQMAATQRGIMWAIESDGEIRGILSGFDWQASQLRIMLRADGLPSLSDEHRAAAIRAAVNFLGEKYHLRNFGYQWVEGQNESIPALLQVLGFKRGAILRDAWRCADRDFADIHQYHFISAAEKPKPKKLGDDDNPGQNLDRDSNHGGTH